MTNLSTAIEKCLAAQPDQSARDLVRTLASEGIYADKSSVNSELYRHCNSRFVRVEGTPPTWRCKAPANATWPREAVITVTTPAASGSTPLPKKKLPSRSKVEWNLRALRQALVKLLATTLAIKPHAGPATPDIALYEWQRQALDAWKDARHRGVVEAVTGTGKTRVGMVAIRDSLNLGGCAHILVPTIDLQDQWFRELEDRLPGLAIGKRGNSHDATFPSHHVVVSVVNSARDYDVGLVPPHSVLVADECHRYGADANARALHEAFPRRLGLTATYGREDDGNERNLDPYFGDTCFRMGYEQAIQDEVTAHFKVALVGVDFPSEQEKIEYEAAARESGLARKWLTESGWAASEPFGEFMKDVSALSENTPRRTGTRDQYAAVNKARTYLAAFSQKRRILAETEAKVDALEELAPCIHAAARTIVFTETIEAAQSAADILCRAGIATKAIHSQLDKPDRKQVLAAFAAGSLHAITAPKVLDEGIDVPEADLAIIFATSKTRRQMVQRMGRVLRRKKDGRLARFILLYVEGTTEAPENGAHESFLDEITEVADDVRAFDSETEWDEIIEYVNDFVGSPGQPPPRMAR